MTLRNIFLENPAFTLKNNIFYQQHFQGFPDFENTYLSLRHKENRLYSDEIVKSLPEIPSHHALRKEWMIRKSTLQRLIPYLNLNQKKQSKILELGCGNGWLANHLATLPNSEVVGVDVNETELKQGSRVFAETKNLSFAYADIFAAHFPYSLFDYIILSGSIQYFRDIGILFAKLLTLLADNGEIHIVDSPVYNEDDVASANIRSEKYFINAGFPLMKQQYHHHTWQMLDPFHPVIFYNPDFFLNRMKRKFSVASPFPWIKIIK